MSAISPSPISTRITTPLRQVATRQWTVLAARGIVQTLVISLAVLLLAAVPLGFFEAMPMVLRIALAGIAWGTIIFTTVFCLRPALHRWNLSRAAQVADKSLPDSEERISSAIELSEAEPRFRGSSELVNHLIKQAEEDAARVDATEVVPFASVFIWAAVFVPVIALWAVSMHFWPQQVGRGLWYSVMPMRPAGGILTPVTVHPDTDQVVIEGGSVPFSATVTVFNGKAPTRVDLLQTFDSTGATVPQPLARDTQAGHYSRTLENLQQSFTYKVSTDRGDSLSSFHVTVLPRPRISAIGVTYQYPKYASQYRSPGPAEDSNANVSAVVGSKVTLSVHALVDPKATVVAEESKLIINDGKVDQVIVPLAKTSQPNVFEAQLDLKEPNRQEYRIALTTTQVDKAGNVYKDVSGAVLKPTNTDSGPYTAEAVADMPPTIAILAPHDLVRLRPIDDVSVMFEAGDDYGVDHVEILVGVDGRPDHTIPVPLHTKKRTGFRDQWLLSVPAILKLDGVAQADHITFQLRATDNRDPDPQYALTERRTIRIDQTEKQSFQERLNEEAKKKLEEAIKEAIVKLTSEGVVVAELDNAMARAGLVKAYADRIELIGKRVATTGTDLSTTAAQFLESDLGAIAKKAQSIADNEIKTAADDTTHVVKSQQRADAEKAHKEIIDARDKLQALLVELQEAAKKAEALQALKDAAKKQEEAAKALAEHPENAEQNKKLQQEAINKLQEAVQKDPQLQDPKAAEVAKNLAELENQIEKNQQQQTELQNQTAKQEEQQQAEQAANAQAEAQKKLNEEIKQFAKEDQKPLDQANAQVPDQAHQEQLVKNIEANHLQQAAQQAQEAADKLKQDAQKLDKQAQQAPNPKAAANADQQKQQQQDQQNQQQAKAAEKQADQAAQALKNDAAQDAPKADAADKAAQNTEKVAQQIEKQAEKIEQQNQQGAKDPQVQKDAEAAKADAQQAAQDAKASAKADNAQEAKQDAAKAAQEVAKAAQELNQAAQAEAQADQAQAQAAQAQAKADQAQAQQAAAQAADQAKALAQKQQEIAQALAQEAQQQADAQQNAAIPAQAAQQQQQLAQQTQQAQQAAQQLAQQAQADQNPQLAQRADQAAKALDQAAKDQQQAAQADAAAKPADAAQAQADAQQALNKAEQALRGQPEAAQAQAADPAQGQPEQGHPEAGHPEAGHPESGQGQPEQTAAQAAAEAAQAQQQALQPNPAAAAEAAQALAQAAHAAEQGQPGQEEAGNEPGNEPGEHTGTHPHQATDPKMGISGSDTGGDNKMPAAVAALGISPSDWAKLRDRDQIELRNAAQQGILPAYKEQVTNYYIRRAQMANDHAK